MDSRTLRRWALYAVLVVGNILILVSAFSSKVSIKLPALPKSPPITKSYVYLPMVSIAPDKLTLQKNHTNYIENEAEQQFLHLVGEISNQSGKNVRNVVIEARLLDRGGMLLASFQGNLALSLLPEGATTCFNLATALPDKYEKYELRILSFDQVDGDEKAVESFVTNALFDRDFGWYAVNGVATYAVGNISGDVAVASTYYDKQKRVVGCEQTFATFPESEVPEPGVFSFYFMGNNAIKVVEAQTLAVNAPAN